MVHNPLSLTEPTGIVTHSFSLGKFASLLITFGISLDLVKYGLIPEFVGRLPVIASVNNLSVDDLVRVLTEPKNSLLKQYEGLFELSQVITEELHKKIMRID